MNKEELLIKSHTPLREVLQRLDKMRGSTLFVVDDSRRLMGSITDGDVRRAMLNGTTMDAEVNTCMNAHTRSIRQGDFQLDDIVSIRARDIYLVPVVDAHAQILKIVDLRQLRSLLPINAVLMAGGKGKRLRPLTKDTPKPLLKVGDKPIVEHNVDRLAQYGIDKIHISLGYLGEQIEAYFGNGSAKDLSVKYVSEEKPRGTIGALTDITDFQHDHILVMNADILTNLDFESFYQEHLSTSADMTVAVVPYKVTVPFGVVETSDGKVVSLREKPEFTYYASAGIYLLKKEVIDLIPKEGSYDAPDLMQKLMKQGKQVVTHQILDYWLDMGSPEDFEKAQKDIHHIKF